MGNLPIKYGLLTGGISIAISVILYLISQDAYLKYNVLPQYIVEIYFMVSIVSVLKFQNGGYINFFDGFKAAWLTYVLAASLIAAFTYLLMNYIDPSLIERLKAIQVEAVEAAAKWIKMPEDDLETQIEIIESTNPYDLKSIANLPVSFIFPGAIIASIIALIKKREPVIPKV